MLDVIRRNSQSWVVKVIFAAIILTFVFWGANTMTSDSAEVLAKVNGKSIYRSDLQQELRLEVQNIQSNNPGLGQLNDEQLNMLSYQVFGRMVNRLVMEQQARKLGLTASDAELSAVVTTMPQFLDANGSFSQDIYKRSLVNVGYKVSKFEGTLAGDILLNKLQSYITDSVNVDSAEARRVFNFELQKRTVEYLSFPAKDYASKVKLEEAEIVSYYSENKSNYTVPAKASLEYLVFDLNALAALSVIANENVGKYYEERKSAFIEPAQYQLRHILVSLPLALDTAEEAVVEARKKAEAIRDELKGGQKFAALAKKYSDDAATKDKGGDLGWVKRGQLEPSLDLALEDIKVGELSEPIRTGNGFHLLELLAEKPERQQSLDEVRSNIVNQLREDAAYANMSKVTSEVEDKIISKEDFAAIARAYKVTPKSAGPADIPALAEAVGLKPDALAGLLDVAPGGMLPAPIDIGQGFMVVKVDAYTPSYIPELAEIRGAITEVLTQRAALKLASDDAAKTLEATLADGGKLPQAVRGKAKISQPVNRYAGLDAVGFSPELTSALFGMQKGEWLNRVVLVGENAVMARVTEIGPPAESEWQELGVQYTDNLNNLRKSEIFGLYMGQVQKESTIDIKTERLQVRGRQ